MFGMASVSTVLRRDALLRFRACAGGRGPLSEAISQNMKNFIFDAENVDEKCLHHVQLDETAIDESLETSFETGLCLGACHHSVRCHCELHLSTKTIFGDFKADLDRGVKDGKVDYTQGVHVATKVLTISIQANKENKNGTYIIGAIGTCGSVDADFTQEVVETVMKVWNEHPGGLAARGPISSLQSDGGSDVLGAGKKILTESLLDAVKDNEEGMSDEEIAVQRENRMEVERERKGLAIILEDLPFFPKVCGGSRLFLRNFIAGCDDKHVLRNSWCMVEQHPYLGYI
jgi:hypothetical protein